MNRGWHAWKLLAGMLLLVACSSSATPPRAVEPASVPATSSKTASATSTASASAGPSTITPSTTASPPVPSSATPALVSAPVSTIDPAADLAAVRASLLVLGDFGAGWSEVAAPEAPAVVVALQHQMARCAGTDAAAATDFGGARAKTGNFTSPSGDVVDETVSFAGSVDEAATRMTSIAAAEFPVCVQPVWAQITAEALKESGAKLEDLTVAKLNVTVTGDETVAYRATITAAASKSGLTQKLFIDSVIIRSARALAVVGFQSALSPFDTDSAAHLGALAASRLPHA